MDGAEDRGVDTDRPAREMPAAVVLAIVSALEGAGIRCWVDGGWGVDAILGRQTRAHDDLDLVVELGAVQRVCAALEPWGFEMVLDALPTRAVLVSADRQSIDLHTVTFDGDGVGWQSGAGPGGRDYPYPAAGFTQGSIAGVTVPTLTAALQVELHTGYEPDAKDEHDMAWLEEAFGVVWPLRVG